MKLGQPRFRLFLIPVRIGIVLLVCGLFVGVALAAGLTDASVDDFYRGSGCYVSQSDTGQTAGVVIITPTAGTIFSGTVFDSGWFAQSPSTLGGGNLYVDNARAGFVAPPFYPAGRTLEFAATFQNAQNQDVGFGADLFINPPWAMFSTGSSGELRAVTQVGATPVISPLGTSYFGSPHLYRIEWRSTDVIYWIDGTAVATHTISIAQSMQIAMEDFDFNPGVSLTLNWMRMSDYAPSPCTFTSRVINSGADGTAWTNFTTTVAQPAGTSISFDVHASADNITWSDWQLVTSNNINLTGRYVQYRAILTTTDPLVTPQLLNASIGGSPLAVTLKSLAASPTTSPSIGWLLAGISGTGLLIFHSLRLIRRRRHI